MVVKQPPRAPGLNYGTGDEISIIVSVIFTAAGVYLNPANRTASRLIVLLASGLSIGALLLIVVSPFSQLLLKLTGIRVNLYEIAVEEGKLSLWWASVVASLYLIRDIFIKSD